jgi:hypothetical protein
MLVCLAFILGGRGWGQVMNSDRESLHLPSAHRLPDLTNNWKVLPIPPNGSQAAVPATLTALDFMLCERS